MGHMTARRPVNRVRPVMPSKTGKSEWEVTCELSAALGYPMNYENASQIMDEIAATTPTFAGVSFARLDEVGSMQWPVNKQHPEGTPIMHMDEFVRGEGRFMMTPYVPSAERSNRKFPLILTTGRILSQYNVGAQTRRTNNTAWHTEDLIEIHESDAELRGITEGCWVELASRVGKTIMRAHISTRVPPGVVYTTFHFPVSGANVVTTEFSDWATNCPEYKVTAVELRPTLTPGGTSSPEDLGLLEADGSGHREVIDSLIRMANHIAENNAHLDPLESVEAVRRHIDQFWTPSMREELTDYAQRHGEELLPVVLEVLRAQMSGLH